MNDVLYCNTPEGPKRMLEIGPTAYTVGDWDLAVGDVFYFEKERYRVDEIKQDTARKVYCTKLTD